MGRSYRNFVFVLMAFAVLYVLVSPLVPTPNALSKNPHAQAAVIVPMLALFAALALPRHSQAPESFEVLRSLEVIEITCSRLC